jgi:hypothetical protein
LSDTSKTEKERLRDYINYLDYSNGNWRYKEVIFFDVVDNELVELD